jgi:hypothetical protein
MKPPKREALLFAIALSGCGFAAGAWLMLRSTDGVRAREMKSPGTSRTFIPPARFDRSTPATVTAGASGTALSTADPDTLKDRIVRPGAWENEALLTFSDPAALRDFLARAASSGIRVTGPSGKSNTLRVSFDSLDRLREALAATDGEPPEVSANFYVSIPDLSAPPAADGTGAVPFGDNLLPAIGIGEDIDRSTWGDGVSVAVIDSGVAAHPAFRVDQVTHVDLIADGAPFHAHGTAIASLVAGSLSGAEGVAPGADILDIRIAGRDGLSDSFLLAQGIHTAIERGAEVINISMATYGDAPPVASAVAEALRRGITVVAAVGNDKAGIKAWPAAYPGVISVSGVDAAGKLAYFSNTGGPTLAAPSVGIPSAYHAGGEALLATGHGTSQATALVSGAAAAFHSRGLDARIALTQSARPGSAKKHEIGAGILFLPPLKSR